MQTTGSFVERRTHGPRRRFFLTATVETSHCIVNVNLCDFSTGGARVEGPIDDLLGRSVVLISRSLKARARVVWFSDDDCGLRFEYPQEADKLFGTKTAGSVSNWRSMSIGAFKRPPVSTSSLSVFEEQCINLWGWERP